MSGIGTYLDADGALVDRLTHEPNSEARLEMITESIRIGEAAIAESDDATAVANAMLALASSYLLAAHEEISPELAETHARAAAQWAGRAVRLAGTAPGPVLFFVPRSATIVAGSMAYVPEETRRSWMTRIDSWTQSVVDAISAQPNLARKGRRDLIVGLSLLEGSDAAQPSEVQAIRAEGVATLYRADRSLTAAGETDLAAEARRALDSDRP